MIPPITPDTERLAEIKNRWKVVGGKGLFSPKPLSVPQETKAPFDIYFLLQTIQALQEENEGLKLAKDLALIDKTFFKVMNTKLTAALEKAREGIISLSTPAHSPQHLNSDIGVPQYPEAYAKALLSDIDYVLPPSKEPSTPSNPSV